MLRQVTEDLAHTELDFSRHRQQGDEESQLSRLRLSVEVIDVMLACLEHGGVNCACYMNCYNDCYCVCNLYSNIL